MRGPGGSGDLGAWVSLPVRACCVPPGHVLLGSGSRRGPRVPRREAQT